MSGNLEDPNAVEDNTAFKCLRIALTEREIENIGIRRIHRYQYKFKQQEFTRPAILPSLFRRHNGIKVLIIHGVILILFAVILGLLTSSIGFEVPYKVGDKEVKFEVPTDVQGLFYVYARIDNFYPGHRNYGLSTPTGGKCGGVKRIEDVYHLRSSNSTPELEKQDPKAELYPCGRQSAMYFNDNFYLKADRDCDLAYSIGGPKQCMTENVTITTRRTAPTERFCLYTSHWTSHKKHKKDWLNTPKNPRAQAWFDPPLVSPMVIQLGKVRDLILSRGNYTFVLEQNVWPAEQIGAKKMLYIVTFGPLGVRQKVLIRLSVLLGSLLIIEALIYLIGVRKDWVMARLPYNPELSQQWVELVKEWTLVHSKRGPENIVFRCVGE